MAWYVAVALVVVVLVAIYASWTAGRLDRLHARLDAAAAALDGQLKLRAASVARLADNGTLPPTAVAALAPAALTAAEAPGLGQRREVVENELSRALHDVVRLLDTAHPDVEAVADAVTRASFARRFHNDAVRDVLVVRRRRIVRLLHLAGHAPLPAYFEMDESPLVIGSVATTGSPYD